MNCFDKLINSYEYSGHMKAGGFQKEGRPALTGIDPELIGDYVILLVRDPLLSYEGDPAEMIAKRLENPVLAGKSGMFLAYSGYYKGAHITAVSGGSGGPEAELALVELMQHSKANTFLRLGGAGGISRKASVGDVVIASGVVREEGLTKDYITAGFPAASSYEVVLALAQGAEDAGASYVIGTARSTDSEHVGVGRPSVHNYFQPRHMHILDECERAGVLYTDRESAAVVTLCNLFGYRGGAVCSVGNNLITGECIDTGAGQDKAVDTVLEGLYRLSCMDAEKRAKNKTYWTPMLSKNEWNEVV